MFGLFAPAGLSLLLFAAPPPPSPPSSLNAPALLEPEPDLGRLKADLTFLCSSDLTGRETGTQGEVRAAAYLAEQMQITGLMPIVAGGMGGASPYHYQWNFRGPFLSGSDPAQAAGTSASDVVGVIPGSDDRLAGEYVFITAHFDHLGQDYGDYYPGADDNASGTAAMLEVARLLRYSHPRRTIAFLGVSGEEEGLLGSDAFLENPPVPAAHFKADINMDMVGRGQPRELHLMPARLEGQVTTLAADAREVAARHGLPLSASIDQHWGESDQFNFARRDIPSVCFNTGLHDDYHQPSDTPDKIDYRKISAVVKIVRDLALKTANADHVPEPLPKAVWDSWKWAPYTSALLPAVP